MQIKLHTHDIRLEKEREKAILKKFEGLKKFAGRVGDASSEIRVDLSHEVSRRNEDTYLCILTLFVPHDTLRAESRSGSVETVIDEVIEKIKRPLEHYKDKTQHISAKK